MSYTYRSTSNLGSRNKLVSGENKITEENQGHSLDTSYELVLETNIEKNKDVDVHILKLGLIIIIIIIIIISIIILVQKLNEVET
jgi:hypothetical protein